MCKELKESIKEVSVVIGATLVLGIICITLVWCLADVPKTIQISENVDSGIVEIINIKK